MTKKLISFILAILLVAAPLFGGAGTVRAASTDDLQSIVEKQIHAFADSIDKSGADDTAAAALVKHGLTGGGKKLSVGKNHALTATLMNSELAQKVLINSCEAAIRSIQLLDLDRLEYVSGHIHWGGTTDSFYLMYVLPSADQPHDAYDWSLTSMYSMDSDKKWNGYDESLTWMAGGVPTLMSFKRTKITADSVTYQVNLEFKDRFDFAISGNDFFKDLISGFGALMFREFDWSAKVTFDLTVPYTCHHESQNYRFTYDAASKTMASDSTGEWKTNDVTRLTYTVSSGSESYYHELEETVRLRHDAPWVMEFDVRHPDSFGFSPLPITNYAYPVLHKNARAFLYLCDYGRMTVSQNIQNEYDLTDELQQIRHYYGTSLNDRFDYSLSKTYIFRMENELRADGSNMIYLTVRETDTGTIVLDRTPMDDHYYYESWTLERTLQDENNAWVSGKDLLINYIGYSESRFTASHFELRIWENGVDGQSESYCKTKVTKPTCTAQGYTTYTCSCCGYSYKADKVNANGHSFGDWTVVSAATCTESGEEQRKCKNCDHSESRTVDALGHNYENFVCTNCGDRKYVPGDVDLNETVDVDDVLALLWNVLFPDDYPIEVDADFDGNGTTDVDDVLTLLWHVLFPEEYPLN